MMLPALQRERKKCTVQCTLDCGTVIVSCVRDQPAAAFLHVLLRVASDKSNPFQQMLFEMYSSGNIY